MIDIWDTNICIYFLQNQLPAKAKEVIKNRTLDNHIGVSVITEIELLSWDQTTENDTLIIKKFISSNKIFELENSIKSKTAEIRKLYKTKLPDAIIAATAIENDLTLITRNSKDFSKIDDLQILNPFDF